MLKQLQLEIIADELDQLANHATFWSRARIATVARNLRNKLRGVNDESRNVAVKNNGRINNQTIP